MTEDPIERRRRLERDRKAAKRRSDPGFYEKELDVNRQRAQLRRSVMPQSPPTPEIQELESRLRELKAQQLKAQLAGRPCDVCGVVPKGEKRLDVLHLDHDHCTGEFRGWLCRSCNLGVGHMRDDADICRRAAAYLDRAAAKERASENPPKERASGERAAPAREERAEGECPKCGNAPEAAGSGVYFCRDCGEMLFAKEGTK